MQKRVIGLPEVLGALPPGIRMVPSPTAGYYKCQGLGAPGPGLLGVLQADQETGCPRFP